MTKDSTADPSKMEHVARWAERKRYWVLILIMCRIPPCLYCEVNCWYLVAEYILSDQKKQGCCFCIAPVLCSLPIPTEVAHVSESKRCIQTDSPIEQRRCWNLCQVGILIKVWLLCCVWIVKTFYLFSFDLHWIIPSEAGSGFVIYIKTMIWQKETWIIQKLMRWFLTDIFGHAELRWRLTNSRFNSEICLGRLSTWNNLRESGRDLSQECFSGLNNFSVEGCSNGLWVQNQSSLL